MTHLLAFQRRRGEGINGVLSRYDVVRQRPAREGNFIMRWEAYAPQLLRACDVSPNQLIQLLQPTNGRLPSNAHAYLNLQSHLRRIWGTFLSARRTTSVSLAEETVQPDRGNTAQTLRPGASSKLGPTGQPLTVLHSMERLAARCRWQLPGWLGRPRHRWSVSRIPNG